MPFNGLGLRLRPNVPRPLHIINTCSIHSSNQRVAHLSHYRHWTNQRRIAIHCNVSNAAFGRWARKRWRYVNLNCGPTMWMLLKIHCDSQIKFVLGNRFQNRKSVKRAWKYSETRIIEIFARIPRRFNNPGFTVYSKIKLFDSRFRIPLESRIKVTWFFYFCNNRNREWNILVMG